MTRDEIRDLTEERLAEVHREYQALYNTGAPSPEVRETYSLIVADMVRREEERRGKGGDVLDLNTE